MSSEKFEWFGGFSSQNRLRSVANFLWYHWKRANWTVSPWKWLCNGETVEIDRPVFLIGNQGAGLTLISRMIRRKKGVVSVTGGHQYWSGADEIQRVMAPRLPPALRLTGNVLRGEPPHQTYSPPRGWTYASEDLFHAYHMTEDHYRPEWARKLRTIIAESIYRFGSAERPSRFIDKSQVYTVKIRLIEALLKETEPHFVLITRNPYAACYRAAAGRAFDMQRYSEKMTFRERLEVCAAHWKNAIGTAVRDGQEVSNFHRMRFEDVIKTPEKSISNLCRFLDIPFSKAMIPAEEDEIPFGTRFKSKWYPIRKNINQKYFEEASNNDLKIIKKSVREIAQEVGYEAPVKMGRISILT